MEPTRYCSILRVRVKVSVRVNATVTSTSILTLNTVGLTLEPVPCIFTIRTKVRFGGQFLAGSPNCGARLHNGCRPIAWHRQLDPLT